MPKATKTLFEELSGTEREALSAFLQLSSLKDSPRTSEEKLLTSLAMAYRRVIATH